MPNTSGTAPAEKGKPVMKISTFCATFLLVSCGLTKSKLPSADDIEAVQTSIAGSGETIDALIKQSRRAVDEARALANEVDGCGRAKTALDLASTLTSAALSTAQLAASACETLAIVAEYAPPAKDAYTKVCAVPAKVIAATDAGSAVLMAAKQIEALCPLVAKP